MQSHVAAEMHGACRRRACRRRDRRASARCEPRMIAASRRAVLRALTSAASVLALGGCARLAGPAVQLEVPDLSVNPTILVATTRKPVDDGQAERWFGSERAAKMSIARAKLPPPAEGRFSLASMASED